MEYTCKYHPEEISETECKCPVCGEDMKEKTLKEQIMEVQDSLNFVLNGGWEKVKSSEVFENLAGVMQCVKDQVKTWGYSLNDDVLNSAFDSGVRYGQSKKVVIPLVNSDGKEEQDKAITIDVYRSGKFELNLYKNFRLRKAKTPITNLKDDLRDARNKIDSLLSSIENFDEEKHPRWPKGDPRGGQWRPEEGTAETTTEGESLGFKADIAKINKAVEEKLDTQTMYSTAKKGAEVAPGEVQWTKERVELHEKILSKLLASGKKSGKLEAQFIAGATANGKSTLLDSEHFEGKLPENNVKVDQDHIKSFLPEYAYLVKKGHKMAAAFAHEESSYLSKELVKRAMAMKSNMVQDSVFDEDFAKVAKKIQAAKDAGYHVKMDYVTLDGDLSLKLARARYEKTGRYVPERYIRKVNKHTTDVFVKLAASGIPHELKLWDTNVNGKPKLVASATGGKLEIHEPELWHNFLMKERPKSKRTKYGGKK